MSNTDLISIILKMMEVLIEKYVGNEISTETFIEHTQYKVDFLLNCSNDSKTRKSQKLAITLMLSKYYILTNNKPLSLMNSSGILQ